MAVMPGRYTTRMEGDFVVFHIGMRINQILQVGRWMPMLRTMPAMINELKQRPELGLLHSEFVRRGRTFISIQYWRTFQQLHAYAHTKDMEHVPAWAAFNRRARGNTAVGIFHETYLIAAGQYECIHVNMPPQGLLRANPPVLINDRSETALQRLTGSNLK